MNLKTASKRASVGVEMELCKVLDLCFDYNKKGLKWKEGLLCKFWQNSLVARHRRHCNKGADGELGVQERALCSLR